MYEKAAPFFELAAQVQPQEVKWHLMVASCFRRTGNQQQVMSTTLAQLAKCLCCRAVLIKFELFSVPTRCVMVHLAHLLQPNDFKL